MTRAPPRAHRKPPGTSPDSTTSANAGTAAGARSHGRTIVIGAGMGGLAAAVELAHQGQDVLVLESAPQPGGKLRQVQVGGQALDAGPTVFTMRWVFEELFERAGTRLHDHLALQPVQTLARHAWDPVSAATAMPPTPSSGRLDLYASVDRSADAIGDFAGAAEAGRYRAFCERARRIYQVLEQPFLRSSRPNPVSLVTRAGFGGLPQLARISPFATLWSALGEHFHDPRLRQLFGRYATYCGSSPFQATATLMLVAHVEQDGVWLVRGGMHGIARAIEALALRHGARFRYGAQVEQVLIENGRASGVRLAGGECIDADAVVFNGDVAALAGGLLGPAAAAAVPASDPRQRSLSALTWNLLAPTDGFPLLHHTVFFSGDYAAEFDDILVRHRLPADPTVYICAQDRDDSGVLARPGPERLLCLVNAPAHGDTRPLNPTELASCQERTFQKLARCGLQVHSQPQHSLVTTPTDFDRLFPGTGGALYGRASHGWMASFSRPGARSQLPGLYLAGGSTHPGPGLPMAALSGHQAACSVLKDHASTHRLHPAATRGGMSTR
jgi:1-hydroxycarotenoid 3,4-desaturase